SLMMVGMWALGFADAALPRPSSPTLRAAVFDHVGRPIHKATVIVWDAKPRIGQTYLCPTCYPDCGRHSKSAKNGTVILANLDPSLLYTVLVVAPGYEA